MTHTHDALRKSTPKHYTPKHYTYAFLLATTCLSLSQIGQAQPLDLSHVDVSSNLQPNVLFMVDDSISIDWEIMVSGQWNLGSYLSDLPGAVLAGDGLYVSSDISARCSNGFTFAYMWDNRDNAWSSRCRDGKIFKNQDVLKSDWRILSNDFNKIYYNPQIQYQPWPGYPNANFSRARSHADSTQIGYQITRNLGTSDFQFAVWQDSAGFTGNQPTATNANATPNGIVDLWDNYDLYSVSSNSILINSYRFKPENTGACNGTNNVTADDYVQCFKGQQAVTSWASPFGRDIKAEQQNIANWYQYHRRRSFALRNVVAQLIELFPNFRYGLDFTNNYNDQFVAIPRDGLNLGAHNTHLLTTLFGYLQKSASTPMATALDRAGQYFQGKPAGTRSPIVQSCQANYALMLTDGFWNDQQTYRGQARGDRDGDNIRGPYGNTTLADIATYYFERDLAPNLINDFALARSKCPAQTPPNYQHMSTIGVTFGPFGNLQADDQNCWPEPALKSNDSWGNTLSNPNTGNPKDLLARIDDLWHAAYNSNGFFTSSADPSILIEELSDIFASISQLNASGARGTLRSSRLDQDNAFILSRYDVATNTGILESYPTKPATGQLSKVPSWSTSRLQGNNRFANNVRSLLSFDPVTDTGLLLSQGNGAAKLTPAQRNKLFPNEAGNNQLNAATQWLNDLQIAPIGALVHANPTFVGQPARDKSSQRDDVQDGYIEFKTRQLANLKREMVYVGDNRGLLRGFDVATGQELLSYLPDALMNASLPRVSKAYTSKMDGSIVAEDVFFAKAKDWRTVIAAGFRYGASGYVALDVTNPDDFSGAAATDRVLWEYSNQGTNPVNNPDLGFSYARPAIGRLANGRWAAVLANGYNSASGQAALIILDIETGEMIRQLDTNIGLQQDPLKADRPNGMAEPALIDQDQDGIVDVIYAGDFYGNLYAFDVRDQQPSQWRSKYGTSQRPQPLFSTNGAPITTRPSVMRYPGSDALLVITGTGQNITPDTKGATQHGLYGIFDNGSRVTSNANLKAISLSASAQGWQLKPPQIEPDNVQGWAISLTGPAAGFQVLTQPQLEFGELTVLLSTTSQDVCGGESASSAILKVNPVNGSSLNRALFLDNKFTPIQNDDKSNIDAVVFKETGINDISLAGTAQRDVIIGNSNKGQTVEINTTPSPFAQGRQRFRRLYD